MNPTALDTGQYRIWPLIAFLGLINLAIGIAVIAWPGATLTVVVFLFGIQLLLIGVLRIVLTMMEPETEMRWLGLLVGILGVIVGLLVMREPLRSLEILVLLLGIFWIVWGIIGLLSAFGADAGSRGWVAFEGAISLAAGGVLLSWPNITVRVFTLILGISMVVIALGQFAAAYAARKAEVDIDTIATA
ncbi:MAG: DUF308 domain-containing protein [Actinomycetota bacterium]|nr:DUF308 domain-containing protein [Actinomycetota bacterium]